MPQPDNFPLLDAFPASAQIINVRSGEIIRRDQLQERVRAAAAAIDFQTAQRNGPVVVAEPDALDMLIQLFAAWAAGRVAVLVNPGLSGEEQVNVIAHTGAVAWYGPLRCDFANPDGVAGAKRPALTSDEPALILMTSGTTGIPKGIVHSLRSLSARLTLNVAHMGREPLARSLCVLPTFFGHGLIGNCLTPLAAGGSLHLWCSPQMGELASLAGIMDRYHITFMSSVPSFWKMAARISRSPAEPPLRLHVGSAPLSIEHWRAISAWAGTDQVYNMFGMTETANWIGGGSLHDSQGRDGYVGEIWGGQFAVCNEQGVIAEKGKGEILVQSPSMMMTYLNAPGVMTESFMGNWFRTGDIGEIDAAGSLTLVGRTKSEINRAGIKIQAEEIDMLLERHPDITEACAFAIEDAASGQAVAAAIVLQTQASVTGQDIRQWCRDRVRAEAVPSVIYILDAIPLNDRGKIVRDQVRAAALQSVSPS
ncbi:MAG: class I adenylate-forming enzyme family protein [Rhizobiaceae bacterium]|nr:class I adenylate-forming enzyme family protein [Rhizobiaceae bacterium]